MDRAEVPWVEEMPMLQACGEPRPTPSIERTGLGKPSPTAHVER